MKKITLDKKTKNDIILTASITIAVAVAFFIIGLSSRKGDYVEVKQNGKLTAVYSLSENRTVQLENGDGYNLLVIADGAAYIEAASCPDKICIRGGRISKDGESLTCLPNRTVVTVYSGDERDADF